MIEYNFRQIVQKYADSKKIDILWQEIALQYSDTKRSYHTLGHLENLIVELMEVREEINDWSAIVFAVVFHDYIYDSARFDNEEQSAEIAQSHLQTLCLPADIIMRCITHILATKGHSLCGDNDTNLFTDSDLSILGKNWESYLDYSRQIRDEYSLYSDAEYNAGRKNVLTHFLTMKRIYKTPYFYEKYELQARENIAIELEMLNVLNK
ncbi:MAG: hypothetical protein IPM69_11105 [Ignavibacteria bacterium]|nr:hypothetical protein [Ignavibacteria bacterium]